MCHIKRMLQKYWIIKKHYWQRVFTYNIPPPSPGLGIHQQSLQPPAWEAKPQTPYTESSQGHSALMP